jgi:hypothetical protein
MPDYDALEIDIILEEGRQFALLIIVLPNQTAKLVRLPFRALKRFLARADDEIRNKP